MKMPVRTKLFLSLDVILLFLVLFPVLDLFTHPISVLFGSDYEPLVIRLWDLYVHTGLLAPSLLATPVLLIAVTFIMQRYDFGFRRSLAVVLTPFLTALFIQYFIAVQLDKYLRFPRMGYAIPWKDVKNGVRTTAKE